MKRIIIIGILILLQMLYMKLVQGQPDFNASLRSNGITLFRDLRQRNTVYYMPGDLVVGTTQGRPDFNLTLMRYTGSAVYGEDESMRHRSILSIRIVMKRINDDSLRVARRVFGLQNAVIRPLPISMIEAMVVFVPVGAADTSAVVKRGSLAAEGDSGYSTSSSYWEERYFTIHLDNHSAQLLLEALRKDYTALSFMYAFHARGQSPMKILSLSGHGQLSRVMRDLIKEDESDSTDALRDCVVKSNAFPLYVDSLKFNDHVRQIDINNGVPPGYAILNVRNYDFANRLRGDLYEKTVELQAVGAGGGKVDARVTFRSSAPDVTSVNYRFKYAVRLDQPYRYRIRELLMDGSEVVTDWQDVSMWSGLLDVTTRKE